MGWSPLWDKLVMSSVWSESKEVKILWITLLALKDRYGEVKGSVIGLANSARLTPEETMQALDVLRNPDPFSSSIEHEGRRIENIKGGWRILNHEKYREMIQEEYKRVYNREKKRESRQRMKSKSLPGEIANQSMQEDGATETELNRHSDSMLPEPTEITDDEGPL